VTGPSRANSNEYGDWVTSHSTTATTSGATLAMTGKRYGGGVAIGRGAAMREVTLP